MYRFSIQTPLYWSKSTFYIINIFVYAMCMTGYINVRLFNHDCWPTMTYYDSGAQFCYHEGKRYVEGTSFQIDCNTCTCSENGLIGCTDMACLGMCNIQVVWFRSLCVLVARLYAVNGSDPTVYCLSHKYIYIYIILFFILCLSMEYRVL